MRKATPKKCVITQISTSMRNGRNRPPISYGPYTLEEAIQCFSYTLECGASYAHEKGNKKINRSPKTFKSLVDNLNKASDNRSMSGYSNCYYTLETDEPGAVSQTLEAVSA